MVPILATPRLRLRPATTDDIDALWQLLTLPEVRLYLCDNVILPRAFVVGLLDRAAAAAPHGLGLGLWVAERAGAMIGLAALQTVPPVLTDLIPGLQDEIEPTIALAPQHWGQGLASEALAALLRHGFATLALPHITAIADVPNTASDHMLNRAGFRRTGEHQGVKYRVRTYCLDPRDWTG